MERPIVNIILDGLRVEKGLADLRDKEAKKLLEDYLSAIGLDIVSRVFECAPPKPSETYRIITVEHIHQCLGGGVAAVSALSETGTDRRHE